MFIVSRPQTSNLHSLRNEYHLVWVLGRQLTFTFELFSEGYPQRNHEMS